MGLRRGLLKGLTFDLRRLANLVFTVLFETWTSSGAVFYSDSFKTERFIWITLVTELIFISTARRPYSTCTRTFSTFFSHAYELKVALRFIRVTETRLKVTSELLHIQSLQRGSLTRPGEEGGTHSFPSRTLMKNKQFKFRGS